MSVIKTSADPGPGAARQGNFINYYQFNPAERRVALLPKDLLYGIASKDDEGQTKLCLDVGCNTGVSGSNTSK